MKKYPVKKDNAEVETSDQNAGAILRSSSDSMPFFSFRYSYKEMSLAHGKTHVKSREHRFEDGKFTSEKFECTMDKSTYHNAVEQTQEHLIDQTNSFLRLLSSFLPITIKPK